MKLAEFAQRIETAVFWSGEPQSPAPHLVIPLDPNRPVGTTAASEMEIQVSIFSNIAAAKNSFIAWIEKECAKLEAEAPTIETMIETGVKYATGVLKILLTRVDAASPAAKIITTAISDLLTLSAVAFDAGAHPSLASGFQDIASNLSALENATGIKNATTLGTVQKVISTIAALAAALLPAAA